MSSGARGTGAAYKCRGSGAPNPNQHPNHPLCHAVCVAAIVFDVVAKDCTVATNFLMFFRTGGAIGVAFQVGAPGVGCAVGRIYSSSGLLLGWAVTLGSKSMGIG